MALRQNRAAYSVVDAYDRLLRSSRDLIYENNYLMSLT
jgi:hypothetical protein